MALTAKSEVRTSWLTSSHNSAICHAWIVKEQSNTTCVRSSWLELQLTQLEWIVVVDIYVEVERKIINRLITHKDGLFAYFFHKQM